MTDQIRLGNATLTRVAETQVQIPTSLWPSTPPEAWHAEADLLAPRFWNPETDLFRIARHRSTSSTVWVLPKGRNAQSEVEDARRNWHGSFHVEPSITAPDSLIVVAKGVRPR